MWYLSGCIRSELYHKAHFGLMLTPHMQNRVALHQVVWGADTGCFAHPERFTMDGYLAWLAKYERCRATNLFATAPDLLGNAKGTLEQALPVLPELRRHGWNAALVAQDGLEHEDVPWDEFDVLFIGGTTDWKLSSAAADLAREAGSRRKWVHMGRVNSLRRMAYASELGCQSVDGTLIAYGPSIHVPKMSEWLVTVNTGELDAILGA